MARIGGRNSWIAWPAGLLCAAVVAALVWLALPMLPVSVAWVGDMLRATTSAARRRAGARRPRDAARSRRATSTAARCTPTTCGPSSPGRRSAAVAGRRRRPPTAVTSLTDALAPSRAGHLPLAAGRRAARSSSTLAGVGRRRRARSPTPRCAVRDSRAQPTTRRCVCTRAAGDVVEEHTVRGGLWLSSVETAWHPGGLRRAPGRARVGLTRAGGSGSTAQLRRLSRRCSRRSPTCSRSARGSSTCVSIRMSSRQNSVRPSVTGYCSFCHVFSQRVPPSGV